MSRTVTHYIEGKPQYRDDGPAYARRAGFGGSAIGSFQGVVLSAPVKPRMFLPRTPLARATPNRHRTLCGALMATLERCARTSEHHDSHRSSAWMDRDRRARRARR